jgi:hypothetical protein
VPTTLRSRGSTRRDATREAILSHFANNEHLFRALVGAEFLGEHPQLCGELSAEVSAKHARLVARMLATAAAAGEMSLAGAGLSATHAAELLLATAEGIKTRGRTTLSARAYQRRLGQAVRIVIAGLAPPAAARGNAGARRLGTSS